MKIQAINDRVVIEIIEEEDRTKSGLYLPENAKEKPQTGKIISIGQGTYQNGILVPPSINIGDTVLFAKYAGVEIKYNNSKSNSKAIVVRESEILAIIKEK